MGERSPEEMAARDQVEADLARERQQRDIIDRALAQAVTQRDVANTAADAAAEAMGAMSTKLSALIKERDHLIEVNAALRTRPDLAERAPLVMGLADKLTALQETNEALVVAYEPLWAVVETARRWREALDGDGDQCAALDELYEQLDALDVSREPTSDHLDDEEVDALAERVAQLPPEEKVDFLLGMLHRIESERDQFQVAATDTWAALFGADRVAEGVELISAEHAAMIPGIVRTAFAVANGVRRTLEAKRDRLRKVVQGSLIAIETILTGDHVDLGVGSGVILGRVSAALKQALDGSPFMGGPTGSVPPDEAFAMDAESYEVPND